jgi:SEL1 protein
VTRFSPFQQSNESAQLALTHWTRSAAQRNVDALVKVGDYYFHGIGTPESEKGGGEEKERLEKAARYYRSAADTQMSALAMWNLGWMYENGVGVPQVIPSRAHFLVHFLLPLGWTNEGFLSLLQDFHLAKRHYDLALETNSEAYIPVVFSLMKLYARSVWHTLMGGKGGLRIWGYDNDDDQG